MTVQISTIASEYVHQQRLGIATRISSRRVLKFLAALLYG
jgi:hypothetical protein